MKNDKVCISKSIGIFAVIVLSLIGFILISQKLTNTQTSTNSRASAPASTLNTIPVAFCKDGLAYGFEDYNSSKVMSCVKPKIELFVKYLENNSPYNGNQDVVAQADIANKNGDGEVVLTLPWTKNKLTAGLYMLYVKTNITGTYAALYSKWDCTGFANEICTEIRDGYGGTIINNSRPIDNESMGVEGKDFGIWKNFGGPEKNSRLAGVATITFDYINSMNKTPTNSVSTKVRIVYDSL